MMESGARPSAPLRGVPVTFGLVTVKPQIQKEGPIGEGCEGVRCEVWRQVVPVCASLTPWSPRIPAASEQGRGQRGMEVVAGAPPWGPWALLVCLQAARGWAGTCSWSGTQLALRGGGGSSRVRVALEAL